MHWEDPLYGNPRYQSVRTLSRSGQSIVQLAVDRTTGEQVAIKFTQRGWDSSQNKYLLRELQIHQELSACRHPHIVELREVFLTPLHLAAVMEHVEGQNLQEFLTVQGGRVSEALARFLFQQLILALDFCHMKGKVSRGVKLANTLLQLAPGQLPLVKLSDFGFSKDTGLHSAPQSQVGTALFVAPEVMHNFNNSPYDGRAVDVWAAGIVLFILLFGRHPFLRPEDSNLSEQQQMLALFTRTAASQFCLLPEEAVAITPSCADLLGHILQTNPNNRYGMSEIQSHPWFLQCLPAGAVHMNALILADNASRPTQLRQPPEAIAAMVRLGQVLESEVLAQRFAPQQPQQPVPAAAAAVSISAGQPAGPLPRSGAPAAAAITPGQQQQQQQHAHDRSWGQPPPARVFGYCASSSDRRQQQVLKMQEEQQQQQQQQFGQPPISGTLNESTSSSHGSFVAAVQQQQQQHAGSQQPYHQQQQQQQHVEQTAGPQLYQQPQQQQQQLSPELQQLLWQPQQRATTSAASSGATTHGAAATAAASSGGAGATAASSDRQQNAAELDAQTVGQQQQLEGCVSDQEAAALYMRSVSGMNRLNSDELEKLIPLDGITGPVATTAPAAAAAGNGRLAGLGGQLPMDLFGSVSSLPHIPSYLPDFRLDSLLDPQTNSLLRQQLSAEYRQQQQQIAQQQDAGQSPSAAATTQQSPAGKHSLEQPVANGLPLNGSHPAAAADEALYDHENDVEIPEEYAAFLVDEDDIAIAQGDEGAKLRRKRVLSNTAAGASSLNLDLRQLSDMLLGGEASQAQLEESSLWHKICRDVSFRERTGGGAAAPDGPRGVDELDLVQSLQGLRAMSITRDNAS